MTTRTQWIYLRVLIQQYYSFITSSIYDGMAFVPSFFHLKWPCCRRKRIINSREWFFAEKHPEDAYLTRWDENSELILTTLRTVQAACWIFTAHHPVSYTKTCIHKQSERSILRNVSIRCFRLSEILDNHLLDVIQQKITLWWFQMNLNNKNCYLSKCGIFLCQTDFYGFECGFFSVIRSAIHYTDQWSTNISNNNHMRQSTVATSSTTRITTAEATTTKTTVDVDTKLSVTIFDSIHISFGHGYILYPVNLPTKVKYPRFYMPWAKKYF